MFMAMTPEEASILLAPIGFSDWRAAQRCLLRLAAAVHGSAGEAFQEFFPLLLNCLVDAADPDRAVINFDRFAGKAADPARLFQDLAANPRLVEILVTLFAGSQFMTEILLRHPEYLQQLSKRERLAQLKSSDQFFGEAVQSLCPSETLAEQLEALRRYQRGELLRIGACDLLNLFDLPAVTLQLSNLADSLVRACLQAAADQLRVSPEGFVVLAMGKLGGQELNYSSDIDLLFLAASDGEAYRRLGERLIEALASVTAEGFLYRVDMRLRPWGKDGALICSVDAYLTYLGKHARLWEKQAMLKARPVAGSLAGGQLFLDRAEPLLFGLGIEAVRASVHAMKQRTETALHQKGRDWGEVKLGEGSIRDVEFVVQFLQLAYGADNTGLRSRSTLEALRSLLAHKLLTPQDGRVLVDGYIFLRTVEHFLQMMDYRQTYSLPNDPYAIALLARRLGFRSTEAEPASVGEKFLARYQQYSYAIRAVYIRHVGNHEMKSSEDQNQPKPVEKADSNRLGKTAPSAEIRDHLARLDTAYAALFSEAEIQRHTLLAEQLDEERLAVVEAEPLPGNRWRVTIVGYDYPGELSVICGLLFVHGLNISEGEAFTYEPLEGAPEPLESSPATSGIRQFRSRKRALSTSAEGQLPAARSMGTQHSGADARRKIVDVFTVLPENESASQAEIWAHYAGDLNDLLQMMRLGQRREARGELAKLVGAAFQEMTGAITPLYPIDIEIDNETSERYTVLRIDTQDTIGFLYEFTNALAFNRVYIARVSVHSTGKRVHDILYVTDANGQKIISPDRQRELRAATVLIKHFTHLLPHSPNPESALLHFREFISELFRHPNWPDELASLESPDVLNALAKVLGVSNFLWDDFLRMQYANLFPVVRDVNALSIARSREQLQADLNAVLADEQTGEGWRSALNAFKDRELFRIDMRHILGHTAEFWDFAFELTDLAELVVQAVLQRCLAEIQVAYGLPVQEDGQPCPLAVCALGKCGGRELGFASDIELMFVYAGKGSTSGRKVITTAEFYEKLTQSFVGSIHAKQEGIFEIDLQLRPYGKAGSMAVSLEAFRRYYAPDGPAWAYERQALVKLRPIAGDPALGEQILRLRDEYVYNGEPFDTTAMRAMRERQVRHLVTGGTFNAKYSPGGLVDIEYLVQSLQINHGVNNPALRLTNVRATMAALETAGILSPEDYGRLRKAHTFLRWLIDSLRVVRGSAKDVTIPPDGSEEFAFLARRLLYGNDVSRLRQDLNRYIADVQELSARLVR